jgi:hypothetical protein
MWSEVSKLNAGALMQSRLNARLLGHCLLRSLLLMFITYWSSCCAAGAGWPLPEGPLEGGYGTSRDTQLGHTTGICPPRNGWPVLAYVPVSVRAVLPCAYTDTYVIRGASSLATAILQAASSGPVLWKVCFETTGCMHL